MKIVCPVVLVIMLGLAAPARAQFGDAFGTTATDAAADKAAPKPVVQRWKLGFSVRADNADCGGILATVPVPREWPEQSVRIIEELSQASPQVDKISFREIAGGVKQMVANVPVLRSGEEAYVYLVVEVTKRAIAPPASRADLTVPRSSSELRPYLGSSPYIESTHPRIKKLARDVVQGKEGAWEKVEAIYDWVREHVEYKNGQLKGALAALQDGDGDCEELTSLFVALCRANRIPARTVWVEGHCYPEFYLVDANREGHWFPCQAAGTRDFGGMFDKRPILQKGDNFKVPEKKKKLRYVAEFLSAKSVRGSGGPKVTFTRQQVLDDQPAAEFP